MAHLLMATTDEKRFAGLAAGIAPLGGTIDWVASGQAVLEAVTGTPVDLVVADEDLGDMKGLELIKRLVAVNPLINCALVSSLTENAYHEASEGLGILMQLPVEPGQKHADMLLEQLQQLRWEQRPLVGRHHGDLGQVPLVFVPETTGHGDG